MEIRGKYEMDGNFTTVYTDDTMYQIAGNGNWGHVKVGGRLANGATLTPELFEKWKAQATRTGTFELG